MNGGIFSAGQWRGRLAAGWLLWAAPGRADEFTFSTNADNTITLTAYNGQGGSVIVPSRVGELPVVEIGPSAFWRCSEVTGIEIPDGMLRVGEWAFFGCAGLTNVHLPQSVTNVADGAFAGCAHLAWFSVDSSNPSYEAADGVLLAKGGGEFVQCPGSRAGAYAVPATVTNIRASAFAGCEGLTNVWIPPSVIAMGADPFASCYNLAAFEVDPSNPKYASMEGVLYSEDSHVLVRYPPGKSGPCVLPDSVADVADFAFSCCTGLSQITLGNAVTNIGASAFVNCQNLNTVTLGSGVARIGAFAFVACSNLGELYIAGNAPSFDGSIYGTLTTTTVYRLSESTGWDAPSWYGYMMSHSALWVPRISDEGLGLQAGRFGFQMNWAAGHAVVVEGCTNLAAPVWLPRATNELADGTGIFEDEEESNPVGRFYRVVPAP